MSGKLHSGDLVDLTVAVKIGKYRDPLLVILIVCIRTKVPALGANAATTLNT
ncbi:hypothetical protein HW450_08685 [Corynebacterium hindlerae]|uniref:Uncharacterized protein n=1 Tax=Corynebacterium hindlerae TaxID=699041 RepID=A0A7G5FCV0_9CORY|nr:hypothetical protein [Corynebacterium hindlerae]QMV84441.1 hypothetical protein HW450_08685 [Corynebacterium hindlerae]